MSDPLPTQLRIAGRGEVLDLHDEAGEGRRPPARPLRAPAVSGPALLQMLFAVLAVSGLFVVIATVASAALAAGVCALVTGLVGVALSALREAGRI